MAFESVTPAAPSPPAAPAAHQCARPRTDVVGPGSVWRCDHCRARWVLHPAATVLYGPGAWLEHALLLLLSLPFLLWPYLRFAGDLNGWRRTRYMGALSVIVVAVVAMISMAVFMR